MKTRIQKFANFCCMVVVLGTQALLQGLWSVPEKANPEAPPPLRE